MAKQRIVNTKFWDDSYITELSPSEKLLFLYLITNPLTNISGVYELPLKRVAFDTGMSQWEIEAGFGRFEKDGKLVWCESWVWIVNFIRHQSLSPKIKQGITHELMKAPKEIIDRVCICYQWVSISSEGVSHPNINSNTKPNSNPNGLLVGELSTEQRETMSRKKEELMKKWRM